MSLAGTLTCRAEEVDVVLAAAAEHIRLTRAEPGCLAFDITLTERPGVFAVSESFRDRAAFDAHQRRTGSSDWWRITGHMARDFRVTDS